MTHQSDATAGGRNDGGDAAEGDIRGREEPLMSAALLQLSSQHHLSRSDQREEHLLGFAAFRRQIASSQDQRGGPSWGLVYRLSEA